jgi:hypothetical protein
MTQAPEAWIGQRRVREQQLSRREPARVVVGDARTIAKEGDLKSELRPAGIEPAGDVPPFVAKRGVASEVARKFQWMTRNDFG